MELQKKTAIHILSVESPNRFLFRTKKDEQKIIANIEAYMMSRLNSPTDCGFDPQLNEMVIVKLNEKFEYARIRKIDTVDDRFICSLSSGSAHEAKRHDITPLPSQLADATKNTTLLGSIVGLVPVKMVCSRKFETLVLSSTVLYAMIRKLQEFNYRNTNAQRKKSHEWSSDSISFFRGLGRTSSVYFLPIYHKNGCFFGEISYIQEKNLSAILLDNNFAMRKLCAYFDRMPYFSDFSERPKLKVKSRKSAFSL